jgi:hypothetical protein
MPRDSTQRPTRLSFAPESSYEMFFAGSHPGSVHKALNFLLARSDRKIPNNPVLLPMNSFAG